MQNEPEPEPTIDDPLVTHSLREAKWIVVVWVVAFVWVVGYCSRYGYYREGETTTIIGGMPAWVFWGVALPWVVATIVSSWFALRCIADESLVDRADGEPHDDE